MTSAQDNSSYIPDTAVRVENLDLPEAVHGANRSQKIWFEPFPGEVAALTRILGPEQYPETENGSLHAGEAENETQLSREDIHEAINDVCRHFPTVNFRFRGGALEAYVLMSSAAADPETRSALQQRLLATLATSADSLDFRLNEGDDAF